MQTIEEVVTRMPCATVFQFWMPAQDTGKSSWARRVQNFVLSTAHLGDTRLSDYHLGYCLPKIFFQRVMTQMFEHIEDIKVVDDILVWRQNDQQHDAKLI